MDNIKEVDIDPDGVFKYILIKITDEASTHERIIVRGYKWAEYHGNAPINVVPPSSMWR